MKGESGNQEAATETKDANTDGISPERIPHLFDLGTKVISLSIALTYLVGFLVVAWHLSKYGVSSLSLLHLQYLVAGLWVVLPPSFVALMMRTKELPIIHMDQRTPKLHWLVRFAVNLATSLPFSIVFALFVGFVVINLSAVKLLFVIFLLGSSGWRLLFLLPALECRLQIKVDSSQEI
jgi:uncharacterized membrane protein YecN with MAPEG domain